MTDEEQEARVNAIAEERKDRIVQIMENARMLRGAPFVDCTLLIYTFMQVEFMLRETEQSNPVEPMRRNVLNVVRRVLTTQEEMREALDMASKLSDLSVFTVKDVASAGMIVAAPDPDESVH